MAQKQYSFEFVMNAVLNGGFSGTFTKAQQEFIRLGNEIKNLQAIQRDIASYQKQAEAVQNTSGKLDNLRRQYELVNRQISETTGSTTALEREKLKLEQRIASTEAALEKQRAKLEDTKDRLDAAGVSTGDLAAKDAALTEKIKELTEEQKKAAESAGEFKNAGVAAVEAVGGAIASAGIAAAIKEIGDAYAECVGVAADFGQIMSAVEAISEANTSEMAALKAEAKELGATTIYTAKQSGKGMEFMAMAGWNATEMLSGMKGMTTLAEAAGEDLAQVSDIVTDNLTAFGLTAADTAHFADVLAAAAANSNTNISIMGDTFKNSSSVAGALGYSIEDVAVMVGLMANNAVKGTRAGTALRNIFDGLLGGITLTSRAFGELEYSAVNYDGSMKGLMETVEDLRGYFDLMTEAEKVNNAQNIAGMRGYNGLLAILNATDKDFQSLYNSIYNCTGAAERMAAVKLDNLNGDITLMNSAMEALQATIGEQFTPELRGLTQLKTELLNGLNLFVQENPALVKGVMVGAGAFGALGTAIVGVNAAIKLFKKLEVASLFTGKAGILLGVAGGIATVATAVVAASEAFRDGGPAVREMTVAARELNEAMEEAETAFEDTATSNLAAANVANRYIDALEEMGDAAQLSGDEQKRYQNTLALLLQVMPGLSECISTTTDEYGRATYHLETTTDVLRANTEEWKKNAQAQAYQKYMNSIMEHYGDVLLEAAGNEIKLADAQERKEEAERKQNDALERMHELYEEAEDAAKKYNEENGTYKPAGDFLAKEYRDLASSLTGLRQEYTDAEDEIANCEQAIRVGAEAVAAADEEVEAAQTAWKKLAEALGIYTDEQENVTAEEAAVREALAGTQEKVLGLAEAYREAYEEAKASFDGQFGLFDEAKADADATVAAAQKALDSQLAYWRDYAQNIEFLRGLSAEELHTTQENLDALIAFLSTGTPEAAALIADVVKNVGEGNAEVVGNMADTIGEVDEMRAWAAQKVADWTVGIVEQTGQLIRDMEDTLKALDMSEDAAEYGRETIRAWIRGAASGEMLDEVRLAFASIWMAAEGTLAGKAAAAARSAQTAARTEGVYVDGGQFYGYASGTDNAPPGWAWVGERGPELMYFHGGETVIPAEASRRLAEEYDAYNNYTAVQGVQQTRTLEVTGSGTTATAGTTVEVHIHVEAGASPETVDAWQDYVNSAEFRAAIRETVEDAQADVRRRSMV